MTTSDFDLSNPNVFKTDVSLNVKCDEVDGVKDNPRIDNPKFTLGGIEFHLGASYDPADAEHPLDLSIEIAQDMLHGLEEDWVIEACFLWNSADKKYIRKLDSNETKHYVFSFNSSGFPCKLTITMDFHCTQLYRLPFVDVEAAKRNRSDCKIILNDDRTKPIYVNKAVLASHSHFFQTMFFGDFQEKDQEEVKLRDVNEVDFLQYLYCVQPPIKPFVFENLDASLRLADRFQNDVLMRCIENFLRKNSKTSKEKHQTLIWAERYEMKTLFAKTLDAMEKADFKDLDCTATAQFKSTNLEAFHKHMCAIISQ